MGRRGVSVEFPHIDRFKDRHGKVRLYYRPPGGKRVPLPALDDPGFRAAYAAAEAAAGASLPREKPTKVRGGPGSFDRLISTYYTSSDFKRLKASTQRQRRNVLDRFCQEHGHRLVAQLTREKVKFIIGQRADTPAAANNLLKLLRMMMQIAIADGWRPDDPTRGIKRYREGSYHTWTEDEIQKFEEKWPIGSRERTAFALHLYTGQRLTDVSRMTWRDYDAKAGTIAVVQEKSITANSKEPTKLIIPVHSKLRAVLEAAERNHMVILSTAWGKAFTSNGFGGWMADAIGKSKVPDHCVTHGLRKAAARRLAEIGCSALEIMSITGHKSLKEAERYVREADQKIRAVAAVARMEEHFGDRISQTPKDLESQTDQNS